MVFTGRVVITIDHMQVVVPSCRTDRPMQVMAIGATDLHQLKALFKKVQFMPIEADKLGLGTN